MFSIQFCPLRHITTAGERFLRRLCFLRGAGAGSRWCCHVAPNAQIGPNASKRYSNGHHAPPPTRGSHSCTCRAGEDALRCFSVACSRGRPFGDLVSPRQIHDHEEHFKRMNVDGLMHPPEFVIKPRSHTVWEKQCVRLHCTVSGWPDPRVVWWVTGIALLPSLFFLSYSSFRLPPPS